MSEVWLLVDTRMCEGYEVVAVYTNEEAARADAAASGYSVWAEPLLTSSAEPITRYVVAGLVRRDGTFGEIRRSHADWHARKHDDSSDHRKASDSQRSPYNIPVGGLDYHSPPGPPVIGYSKEFDPGFTGNAWVVVHGAVEADVEVAFHAERERLRTIPVPEWPKDALWPGEFEEGACGVCDGRRFLLTDDRELTVTCPLCQPLVDKEREEHRAYRRQRGWFFY